MLSFNNIHLIHDSSQSSLSLSCLIRNCRWCSLPVLVWREMYVVLRDWCMEYIKDTVVNDWAMMMMEYKNISKNESLQSLKWNIFALHFQRLVGPLFLFFFPRRPIVPQLSGWARFYCDPTFLRICGEWCVCLASQCLIWFIFYTCIGKYNTDTRKLLVAQIMTKCFICNSLLEESKHPVSCNYST